MFYKPVKDGTKIVRHHFPSLVFQRALNSFFEADLEKVFEEDFPESETSPPKKKQKVEKKTPGDW